MFTNGSTRCWRSEPSAWWRPGYVINDVLDLAKMEAGKMQIRAESFSIDEVSEGVLAALRPFAEKKNIDLRHQIAPGLPPQGRAGKRN